MQRSKSRKGLAVLLGIIWGIMIIAYFFSIRSMLSYHKEHFYADPEYILGSLIEEDYGGAYVKTEDMLDFGLKVSDNQQYAEVVAEHDYMEAAALFKVYAGEGMDDLASKYKEKMEDAKRRLGGLSYVSEEIDAVLGLTE